MPHSRVQLVVTGDDFGYCPRRNRGIVDCFLHGAISNVSLLVNAAFAKDAAELAKRHNIPIGLHANLSEGLPICEKLQKGSSLLNQDGFFHGKMGFRKMLQEMQLNMSEVEQELTAQVELFQELTGHLPHHMDGHQHVHVLPEVRDIFARVLSSHQIKFTRVPIELGLHGCSWVEPHLKDFYLQVEKDSLNSVEVFIKHDIRWPDAYIGLTTMGKNMSVSRLKNALQCSMDTILRREIRADATAPSLIGTPLQPRCVTMELMVHPGYPSLPEEGGCGEGPDDFSQSPERLHEFHTLNSSELLEFYKKKNLQICAFKDLYKPPFSLLK
ncbi:YDJC deacetylase, partial [Polypterus senegalus]|nr:carbohydrate deacetylase isoform X1 [Polypterus senegalus]XP_039627482.1 carbohydrate deacetylase isoform X1 [Polypterus senegalus]MBN3289225.1 YDJC deacetylase [Polypterus senegalus]